MDKKAAYEIVLNDLISDNTPGLFKGKYDTTNGKSSYMYGISAVMEYIAYKVSDKIGDEFSDMFVQNMIKSEEKAEKNDFSQKEPEI